MASAGYTSREVSGLLDLSLEQIRSFVRDGFLDPGKGERGEYRFTFRDLVLLRTAKSLLDQDVPLARIRSALNELKRQIPGDRPITSVDLVAIGKQIVAKDGDLVWHPESGQGVFPFEAARDWAETVTRLIPKPASADPKEGEMTAEDWFELGCELEAGAPKQARDAYRRALELKPDYAEVRLNLGRLLHQSGELPAAEGHYRLAINTRPKDATALFNLGVVLDDQGRAQDAIEAYREAIRAEPLYKDAYYNLARLLERLGRHQEALRTLGAYRQLTEGS
jgi:tetratricopeptide (TPR) repeat protein